jgi:phosphohistidine swiveling domain-containing protein
MQKELGFSYEVIIGVAKEEYIDWSYPVSELERHTKIIFERLKKDPFFLEKTRKRFDEGLESQEKTFRAAEGDLSPLPERELLNLFHKFVEAREYTVGVGHVIESISLAFEQRIRHILQRKASGKKLNEDFSAITAPTTPSFLSQKDELLFQIKKRNGKEKQEKVREYLRKYYWIQSGYMGGPLIQVKDVLRAAEEAEALPQTDPHQIKTKKESLMREYGFLPAEKQIIHWIEFVTDWQDDRKSKIMRGDFGLTRLIEEISRRFGVSELALEYHLGREITSETLRSGKLEAEGMQRRKGCVLLETIHGSEIRGYSNYQIISKGMNKNNEQAETLSGACASMGTATGPVRILTTLDSISKMKDGEILVASMTRPEYVPAMKKAAAIVTDEGGITSHAAIVSRELGKPCVIGTKVATKVLKDGWIVQVKASHGQVVVVEKGEKVANRTPKKKQEGNNR